MVKTGELLGDRRRLKMLMALVDGQSWPAGDLARYAKIQPATASYHLELLVSGGLLAVIPQGRHRYYRLTSPAVADLLEHLAAVAKPTTARSLRGVQDKEALSYGRTCYSHLAGQLGVAWRQCWIDEGHVLPADNGLILTESGRRQLALLDLEAKAQTVILQHSVDWTQRVPHFAGPLAKAATDRLLVLGWIARGPIPRAIYVTQQGEIELPKFGIPILSP